ncbi:MAG: transporter [Synechococcaceae cyanobacterium]|nr:transporter [Synechococcaceae cyanobacterium]
MQLLIPATLFTLMVALGLGLQGEAVARLRRRPALIVRVLLGTCVLVPLAALLLLRSPLVAGLPLPVKLAIALMAISPSAPLTLRKADRQGGDRELAAVLQLLAAAAAVITIPLLADLYRAVFQLSGWDVQPLPVARQVLMIQGVPLMLGVLVRRRLPALAERLVGPLERVANLLLLLLTVLILVRSWPLLQAFLAANLVGLACMALMVLLALAIGWLLSGPGLRERTTVAVVTSTRNPGLALLLASTHAPGVVGLKLAILVYVLLTLLLSLPFLRLHRWLVPA